MISDKTIGLAVERGLVTPAQADGLLAIEREVAASPDPVDDEQLRFVSGFADIFVTIGILLFVGALAAIMDAGSGSTPALAGIAASAWLLAEFFTGKRRMALPSIVLLVLFVGAVLMVSPQVFGSLLPQTRPLPDSFWFVPVPNALALAVSSVVTAGLAALHYVRFRVPITIAAGSASLCLVALGLVAGFVPDITETAINVVLLVCGLAVFALAMRFDMSDPERRTRRTDIAFWLHLLAAPLIVHPLLRGLLHGFDMQPTVGQALGVLWVFVLLGVVAVAIDRRAILVSGLIYAGIAFGSLIKTYAFTNKTYLVPTVALALGAFILLISAGWQPLRRAILKRLPDTLARRLPHPLANSAT